MPFAPEKNGRGYMAGILSGSGDNRPGDQINDLDHGYDRTSTAGRPHRAPAHVAPALGPVMTAGLTVHRHNGEMLRVALWGVRITGLVNVGLLAFLSPPSARARPYFGHTAPAPA